MKKNPQGNKKPELTIKSLGEMLIEYIDNAQEDSVENRLFQPKRQLINYLFNGIGYLPKDQLENQLSSAPLEKEENQLLSKLKNIHGFLMRFNKYINFVCSDINIMIASIQLREQTLFQIDEFLQIIYSPIQNSITAQCKLDLLKNILSCKAGQYRLKIICGSKTIISIDRSSNEEKMSVTDKIKTLMTVIHNNYDSKEDNNGDK